MRRAAGVYVFALRFPPGKRCLNGTMRLTVLGADLIRYRWQGRYRDGSLAASHGRLHGID